MKIHLVSRCANQYHVADQHNTKNESIRHFLSRKIGLSYYSGADSVYKKRAFSEVSPIFFVINPPGRN